MSAFDDTPLFAAAAHLDRVAVVTASREWSWREVHAASLVLAGRLRGTGTVCNLCGTRLGFLVTWLAALRSGCVQVLPPSGGSSELSAMLAASADPLIVVDDEKLLQPQWTGHARCMTHAPQRPASPAADAALTWSCDLEAPWVRLFTSGSTGVPQAQVKSIGLLARGAQVLAARIDEEVQGGAGALQAIICSVLPQHMFGLETSVMLPLVAGIAVVDSRPLLPADVCAAFDERTGNTAWIATPLHLRALAQAGESLPNCAVVIASTMPLAREVAQQAEGLVQAPVLEIYGSTETGVVAMRRTARDTNWLPVQGVRVEPTDDGASVWGTHFTSPQVLADQVAPDARGGFELLGRQADLLKIGGRRASLAGLNLLLQDLPGLVDGVFYLPATGSLTERLVLIHAGPPLDRAATEAWLAERMDAAFLPRTIIRVDRLPRTEGGKLPRAALDALYANRPRKGQGG
ncbi:MAG TPA: AMP-binding protein [Ramlibacter sp.]|nr:AMP-binding protein [Ramlibacter sp.]